MAHKKGLGSSRNGRDSNPKYLGVKLFAGQVVTGGEIIVRQRGTRFNPGPGTGIGKDDTIFAKDAGIVQFRTGRAGKRYIYIEPLTELTGDALDKAVREADIEGRSSMTADEKRAALGEVHS